MTEVMVFLFILLEVVFVVLYVRFRFEGVGEFKDLFSIVHPFSNKHIYGKVPDELIPIFEKIRRAQVWVFFGVLFFWLFF